MEKEKLSKIILVLLLALAAILYIYGVYITTEVTSPDAPQITTWIVLSVIASVLILAGARHSVPYILMLFGIHFFSSSSSLLYGIKSIDVLKEHHNLSGYFPLTLAISIILLVLFVFLTIFKWKCRDKYRIEAREKDGTCPGKYSLWVPAVICGILVFLFALLSIGNWIAYYSGSENALISFKLTEHMGSHIIFEIFSVLTICVAAFWIESRKLWCLSCTGVPYEKPEKIEKVKERRFFPAIPKISVPRITLPKVSIPKIGAKEVPSATPIIAEEIGLPVEVKKEAAPAPVIEEKPKGPVCPVCDSELYSIAYKCPYCGYYHEFVVCTRCKQEATLCQACGKPVLFSMEICSCGAPISKEIKCEKCQNIYPIDIWNGSRSIPLCPECGAELQTKTYECPHCREKKDLLFCQRCGKESIRGKIGCEKCGNEYDLNVWKGLTKVVLCGACGSELYSIGYRCPECEEYKNFLICPKCKKEYMEDGSQPPASIRCEKCGKEFEMDVWKGTKPKPVYCPICGSEVKYVTIICPGCYQESQSRFCSRCNDLVIRCVECGALNLLRDEVCRGCGHRFEGRFVTCPRCGLRIGNPLDNVKT